ncbi:MULTISPECIES: ester cyclase [Bacillus]|uniref:Ester cyclase n=1 Tax=Bacillus glycinifermentans TaxID=1664069 RepID=A0AAJ4D393_9BACI|nr:MULTISPECIES: ester cyclase [Bacillus]KKB73034.1 ester cyclase [Bacillus sp. TH008]MDU0070772.1 ester cyclase [Bacillus sp. IG6]MED8018655.1 ester cyclase [Bacillus glycinifermentans]QAT66194.1 ester cyclase [Bacillus glycinifermentans]WKB75902.1 ester cyclase [Bacillus glycinifermentans]
MSLESNKELVRRFFETIEQQKYDDLKDFCHKDFVFYPQLDTQFPGVEGLIESEKKNFDAFPGFKMPIKAVMAEGDLVSVYFIFEGKHTGTPFAGVPATGKSVKFSLMILLRIADGNIIEQRSHVDVHDILRQLT